MNFWFKPRTYLFTQRFKDPGLGTWGHGWFTDTSLQWIRTGLWPAGRDTPPFPARVHFSVGVLFTSVIRRKLKLWNLDPKNNLLSPSAPKQELSSLLPLNVNVTHTFFVPPQRHFPKPTPGLWRLFMVADCCSQQDYEKQAEAHHTVIVESSGGNAEPQACPKPAVYGVRKQGC